MKDSRKSVAYLGRARTCHMPDVPAQEDTIGLGLQISIHPFWPSPIIVLEGGKWSKQQLDDLEHVASVQYRYFFLLWRKLILFAFLKMLLLLVKDKRQDFFMQLMRCLDGRIEMDGEIWVAELMQLHLSSRWCLRRLKAWPYRRGRV